MEPLSESTFSSKRCVEHSPNVNMDSGDYASFFSVLHDYCSDDPEDTVLISDEEDDVDAHQSPKVINKNESSKGKPVLFYVKDRKRFSDEIEEKKAPTVLGQPYLLESEIRPGEKVPATPVICLWDCGATSSLIKYSVYKKLARVSNLELTSSSTRMTSVTGTDLKHYGTIDLEICYLAPTFIKISKYARITIKTCWK